MIHSLRPLDDEGVPSISVRVSRSVAESGTFEGSCCLCEIHGSDRVAYNGVEEKEQEIYCCFVRLNRSRLCWAGSLPEATIMYICLIVRVT
jgi:hypothetical protein